MRCPRHLHDRSSEQQYYSDYFFSTILQLPAFSDGLDVSSSDGIPRRGTFAVNVRARAITCPIFQCFVCLCEIVSTNCRSSCVPKHSYMHNHASYMFMHLIKLSGYSYASAFSIPMLISIRISHVNFKFLLPTINIYYHVNFKIQQPCQYSCQIQAPAVMSIKFNLLLLSGQAASSHPRTACTYSFDIRRATSSDPRTARAFYFVFCQPSN